MKTRHSMTIRVLFVVLICGFTQPLWAVNSVLSGEFTGSEARTQNLPGSCGLISQLGYQVLNPVTVSMPGDYTVADAFNFNGVDITALIYDGNFDPANPQTNLLTPNGVDVSESVSLNSGVNYTLVVQHWCDNSKGAWAVTLSGPGSASSSSKVTVPEFTMGSFSGSDPVLDSECGDSQYQQTGPIQVARTGAYFYTDISINFDVDACLQIYTAPVNTANPSANRVALIDDAGLVNLQSATNYYFVIQPFSAPTNGEFFYVFAPPASFRMNAAMAGSWFNPATSGQGFFLDVFEKINQVFLAWFTYDLSRPAGTVTAEIGDPGHRWLTAFGPFEGGSADLDIEWTVGGVFDAASPAPTQTVDGSIQLDFNDCETGTITYDLGSSNASGVVPIQRIVNDNVELCESLISGPGSPGPL